MNPNPIQPTTPSSQPVMGEVRAWSERLVIPTYRIGHPDKNPMFLEKRVYQGSSGVVYPHAVIDRVYDELQGKEYTAVFLENRYLKIMLLPEIGGRVQMALDKTNNYHFVYYNRVIKPALVGLAGPWISGGIEFNWPQHHRPSTFDPLDWCIDSGSDGSQTVWCAEIERMFRTKGMHGFTLHPDKAYLEIQVQLYNRTSEPQTFLWWANPAVQVNDDYQSVFPPDVHAVMDHGKRAVSDFPIATGEYYKVNYAPGTDISRYKNIPVPTSYMAYHSDFDFIGCYDHGRQAGMMHVANHHIVPGKKQWTWGCGDFGQAWDRQLTDEDGPYIELMCGAYTDNQPDFSWIQPGEEKRFSQVFMPYKQIGAAKNASRDAVINLEVVDGRAQIGVYVTSPRSVQVCLELSTDTGKQLLYNQTENLSPEQAWQAQIPLPGNTLPQTLTLRLYEASGKHSEAGHELLSYSPLPEEKPPIPAPASPAPPPDEVRSNEELFLHGQHLEQYRHATFAPEPYYEEALRRDPLDSRCNNALGLLLYRRGKFSQAEAYFRHAVERQTMRNPNPYDGEPFYNLGLALKMQGRLTEAYAAFYKATWNAAWQDAAYFELARLASRAGRVSEALALAELAIQRNARHFKARHLKIALLRHQGDPNSPNQNLPGRALDACNASLELDRLEYGALWEMRLLADSPAFEQYVRMHANTFIELALDYAHAGLYSDAVDLLSIAPQQDVLVHYTLGWVWLQAGNQAAALAEFQTAAKLPPDYCFPNRLEDVLSLQAAQSLNPADSRAPYYLGNFWYAHRQYEEAITCWEQACRLDPDFPTVHRNLGLAYYNKRKEPQRALESFELAFQKNPEDARVLFELDQLYKKLGRPPAMRLALLERYPSLVEQRDDLMIEQVALLNLLGRSEEALDMLCCRKFHPWEGGEGKVTNQYVASLVEISRRLIARGEYRQAIENLERARTYPANLGEGKLYGAQENNIFYYLGLAHQGMRDFERARQYYTLAARGPGEPSSTRYYNDQPPEMIFYQGLARQRLGEHVMAITIFQKLVDYGTAHLEDDIQMDYFAVSLPLFLVFEEDLSLQNRIHCYFMKALGYTGLGQQESALDSYAAVLALDANHLGATQHQRLIDSPGEPHPQAI